MSSSGKSRFHSKRTKQTPKKTGKISESWFDWPSVSIFLESYFESNHEVNDLKAIDLGPPLNPMFLAKEVLLTLSDLFPDSSPASYKKLVPMQLHWEEAYLIQEFYHNFKRNFASRSKVHWQYCWRDSLGFKKCFEGSSRDIQKVFQKMNDEFASAFASCFHSSFDKIVLARKPTKEVVEGRFLPLLLENVDEIYFRICKKRFMEEMLHEGAMIVMSSFEVLHE